MISEKINRNNKREEKNMGKRKIIQITVLTTLVLTLSFASASTMADAKTKNGFTYKITKNQVKIVSCSKNQKRIVIPNKIAGKKVVYVSGEESLKQIKMRAQRLGGFKQNVFLLCETDINAAAEAVREAKPDMVVVDSVQTMYRSG